MDLSIVVNVVVVLVVQAAMWVAAGQHTNAVQFGVRVPPDRAGDPGLTRNRWSFRVQIGGIAVVTVPLAALAGLTGRPWLIALIVVAVLAADVIAFLRARAHVADAKRAGDWYAGRRQAIAVDTALRTSPPRLRRSALAQPIAVIAVTAAAGAWRYPDLPPIMVLHFDGSGHPDRIGRTSVATAFLPVVMQIVITAVIVALALLVLRVPGEIDPGDPEASTARVRAQATSLSSALLTLGMCVNISLALLAWQQWRGTDTLAWPLVIGSLTAALLGVVVVVARAARASDRRPAPDPGAAEPARFVHRDDDQHWRGGLIYRNPDDPKLFVPKRFGIGLTVNFAHPLAWALLAGLVAVLIASFVLTNLAGG